MVCAPSNDPNRFDSIAGIWTGTGSQFITWYHESKTGECRIDYNIGAGNKSKEFSNYDSAQAFYTKLLTKVS